MNTRISLNPFVETLVWKNKILSLILHCLEQLLVLADHWPYKLRDALNSLEELAIVANLED